MSDSRRWTRPGIWGFAASLILAGALPASALMSHDAHVAKGATSDLAKPVHAQAGPALMDKMSKAVEQIERQVHSKGPFQGASAHAMQQGVLLVADDMDKVKVSQGGRCQPMRLSVPTT
jgi:manganese oxidase